MKKSLLIYLALFLFFRLPLNAQALEEEDEMLILRRDLAYQLFPEENPQIEDMRNAFIEVKRELYIDNNYRSVAYKNMPIPAERGLIQPSPEMIASILKESMITSESSVLVIGRNTLYLNSLLYRMTEKLYVIDPGIKDSREIPYNYKNDMSYFGWLDESPFSIIVLFGTVESIPHSLAVQLVIDGKIIAPLSYKSGNQILVSARRSGNGFEIKSIGESYIHSLR